MKAIFLILISLCLIIVTGCKLKEEYHIVKCEDGQYSYIIEDIWGTWKSSIRRNSYEEMEKFMFGVMKIAKAKELESQRKKYDKEECKIIKTFEGHTLQEVNP